MTEKATYVCPLCGAAESQPGYCSLDGAELLLQKSDVEEESTSTELISLYRNQESPSEESSTLHQKAAAFFSSFKEKADNKALPILPEEVSQRWRLTGEQTHLGNAFDEWMLESKDNDIADHRAIYRLYKASPLTDSSTLNKIQSLSPAEMRAPITFLPPLVQHGYVTYPGGLSFNYEITPRINGHHTLSEWIKKYHGEEGAGIKLFNMLMTLLGELVQEGISIIPISLAPEDLMVTDSDTLQLRHTGCLVGDAQSILSEPTPLLHPLYSAPEVREGRVEANSPIFSIGQLIAELMWKAPLEHTAIRGGAIPVKSLDSRYLAHVLLGCLHPDAEKRFNLRDLKCLLDSQQDPELPTYNASEANASALQFSGQSYFRFEDLAPELTEKWDEALVILPTLLSWLDQTPFGSIANALAADNKHTTDWKLLRLISNITPELPLAWNGIVLHPDQIRALAQRSLNGNKDDAELLEALFEAKLEGSLK